jgi:hypothetical protein
MSSGVSDSNTLSPQTIAHRSLRLIAELLQGEAELSVLQRQTVGHLLRHVLTLQSTLMPQYVEAIADLLSPTRIFDSEHRERLSGLVGVLLELLRPPAGGR